MLASQADLVEFVWLTLLQDDGDHLNLLLASEQVFDLVLLGFAQAVLSQNGERVDDLMVPAITRRLKFLAPGITRCDTQLVPPDGDTTTEKVVNNRADVCQIPVVVRENRGRRCHRLLLQPKRESPPCRRETPSQIDGDARKVTEDE